MSVHTEHDRRVVLICFECVPGAGSEAGVGWAWAKAAAADAEVIVLTDHACVERAWAGAHALGGHVVVVGVGPRPGIRRLFPAKAIFLYYLVWQAMAARALRRCERELRIDVVHHVTWASDSLPSALLASHAPRRIWGPVGGSTDTAPALYRYLSTRGRLDDVVRRVLNGTLRATFGRRNAKHATLTVAFNDDVADHFRPIARSVTVEPNLAIEPADLDLTDDHVLAHLLPPDTRRTAIFVGRLIPWKGLLLAIRAVALAPGWRLIVVGEGPEQARGEELAASLGIADRVRFTGRRTRPEVFGAFAEADALLIPTFHDSGPWVAGEAAAMGCPVVCLDAGGAKLLAGRNGHPIDIGDGEALPERLAECLEHLGARPDPDRRWVAERLPDLLRSWYGEEPARRPLVASSGPGELR
ncbi:glycosyltransferase [Aquihabitans sp. McL0605]|uniref:glycosyltransferase n=1 Tax=Aquihabitans sp. McL0605 TaxID=3415671 RepID=UPI003CE6D9F2